MFLVESNQKLSKHRADPSDIPSSDMSVSEKSSAVCESGNPECNKLEHSVCTTESSDKLELLSEISKTENRCTQKVQAPSSISVSVGVIHCSDLPSDFHSQQQNDPSLGLVLQGKLKNTGHSNINGEGSECRHLKQLWDQLFVQDGVLYRLYKESPSSTSGKKQLVPKLLRDSVLNEVHGIYRYR